MQDTGRCKGINAASLHVIVPYFNPVGSKRREMLYRECLLRLSILDNIQIHAVVLDYPGQHFIFGFQTRNIYIYRCTASYPMFHKENLINRVLERLPLKCKYAWIDGDVAFSNPTWPADTLKALDMYDMVQLFSQCVDLNLRHEPFNVLTGWAVKFLSRDEAVTTPSPVGLAWAARKEVLPCLFEKAIFDGGDSVMARYLSGQQEMPHGQDITPYQIAIRNWLWSLPEPYSEVRNVSIGFVSGLLLHYWHGTRKNRQGRPREYRSEFLHECYDFDVNRDLNKVDGILGFTDPTCKAAVAIRAYFKSRQDDSTVSIEDESKI